MRSFFIADPHFDHDGVLEMCGRPFDNISQWNRYIIDRTNDVVGVNDRLFMLGDIAWYDPKGYLARIKCKNKHLIWGNHDKPSFAKYFSSTQDVLEIKIGKDPDRVKVWLSHYAHAYWPSSHYGALHLYGHTHSQREETLDNLFPGRRSMDCGVDNAYLLLGDYRPFSEEEVLSILLPRPGHDHVEHYVNIQRRYHGRTKIESEGGSR